MSKNNIPTPDQIEAGMLKKEESNPLDIHAQLFFLYNPRFQSQLQFMSKKQLLKLAYTLADSDFNKSEDLQMVNVYGRNINTKGLKRVIGAVIEHPLSDTLTKLMDKREQRLFHTFDGLLTNKYFNCLRVANEKMEKDAEGIKSLEDVIVHRYNQSEFNSRETVEKDAFATSAKILASKFLMMMMTYLETAKEVEEKNIKEKENGKMETDGSGISS